MLGTFLDSFLAKEIVSLIFCPKWLWHGCESLIVTLVQSQTRCQVTRAITAHSDLQDKMCLTCMSEMCMANRKPSYQRLRGIHLIALVISSQPCWPPARRTKKEEKILGRRRREKDKGAKPVNLLTWHFIALLVCFCLSRCKASLTLSKKQNPRNLFPKSPKAHSLL